MVNDVVDFICSSADGTTGGRSAGWKRPPHIAEVPRLHIAHKSNVTREKIGLGKRDETGFIGSTAGTASSRLGPA